MTKTVELNYGMQEYLDAAVTQLRIAEEFERAAERQADAASTTSTDGQKNLYTRLRDHAAFLREAGCLAMDFARAASANRAAQQPEPDQGDICSTTSSSSSRLQ